MSDETLARYQWRFRNNALSGAQEHSIGMSPVYDALQRLGLTPEFFPPGPGVEVNIHDDLPEGTVVYVGSPDDVRRLGVFRRHSGSWVWVFGAQNYPTHIMTATVVPGMEQSPDWLTAKPGKNDAALIKRFKARAFQVGAKTRARTSWCGAYEDVMRRVDVTADAVRGVSGGMCGDTPSQSETVAYSTGSLLAWIDPDNASRWAVYARDDSAQNNTRTQRIHGNRGEGTALGNWRAGCRVIWVPEDNDPEWSWEIPYARCGEFLSSAPVGVKFRYSGEPYHKTQDGKIGAGHQVLSTGPWNIRDSFSSLQITVTGLESS